MDWKPVEVLDEYGNGFEFLEKDGLVMPSIFTGGDARLKAIKELPYSRDDVLICTYPKTGTHWIYNLVHFLFTDGPLDDAVSVPLRLLTLATPKMWEEITKSPFRATHLKPDRLPSQLLENGGKIILLVRNPKDACLSFYHHLAQMRSELKSGGVISLQRYIEAWIHGEMLYGTYYDYYNAWEKEIVTNKKLDVLVVQFERLKEDGLNEIRRIQEFLGMNHPDERLQQILDKCTVTNLKADVDSGRIKTILVDGNGSSIIYRKGEMEDWKNYLTVAQSEYLDNILEDKLKDNMLRKYMNL